MEKLNPTEITWLAFDFKWPKPNHWVLDPEFGWLEFSALPYSSAYGIERFLRRYVVGYGE